jgi:hypothetical protein
VNRPRRVAMPWKHHIPTPPLAGTLAPTQHPTLPCSAPSGFCLAPRLLIGSRHSASGTVNQTQTGARGLSMRGETTHEHARERRPAPRPSNSAGPPRETATHATPCRKTPYARCKTRARDFSWGREAMAFTPNRSARQVRARPSVSRGLRPLMGSSPSETGFEQTVGFRLPREAG